MPKQTFFNLDKAKQQRILDCAIDEFASHSYEHVKLSNIIKKADIPRGSFYQYFDDKFDLYNYIFDVFKDLKLSYLSDAMKNPTEMPFLELLRELYMLGIRFAMDHPKLVKMTSHLLALRNDLYQRIIKDNLDVAVKMYVDLIELDKTRGRIRPEVDSETLARLVVDLTTNVSIEGLDPERKEFNYKQMLERITHIINIIGDGVRKV